MEAHRQRDTLSYTKQPQKLLCCCHHPHSITSGTPHEPQHHPSANKFHPLNSGGFGPRLSVILRSKCGDPKEMGTLLVQEGFICPHRCSTQEYGPPQQVPPSHWPSGCWLLPGALHEFFPLFSFVPRISGGLGKFWDLGNCPELLPQHLPWPHPASECKYQRDEQLLEIIQGQILPKSPS